MNRSPRAEWIALAGGTAVHLLAFVPPLVLHDGWRAAGEPAALAFLAIATVWIVSEARAVHSARRAPQPPAPPGTLVWWSALGVLGTLWSALLDRGSLPLPGGVVSVVCGALLMLGGLALRALAIATLQRCFLDAPTVLPDHALVTHGVYARMRHPAEVGTLAIVLGAAVLLGSAVALAALIPLAGLAVWRIRAEDRVLSQWRPTEWEAYRRAVPALIPMVSACTAAEPTSKPLVGTVLTVP